MSGRLSTKVTKLSAEERRRHIIESIERLGGTPVMNLAQEHGVTSQTIRRDLQELESRGLIQKGHGVALPGPGSTAIAYKDRNAHQTELKRRLMAPLAEFIHPGSTIYVGLGTTFNSIHEVLRDRSRLIVATSNLGVAYACTFNTTATLYLFGGYVRRNDTAILASLGGGVGNTFKFDLAILGANAIDEDGAVLAHDPLEVAFVQEVIAASRQVIFVVQADKFGGRAPHAVSHLRHASVLITDCNPRSKLNDPAILNATRVVQVKQTFQNS
jgi:DeoR family transcriptional regulator, glycerol-3-phosphate regulon repressor